MKTSKSNLTRRGVILGLIATIALGATACTSSGSSAAANTSATKTITIATSNDAPFSFVDSSGKLQGVDGEMITAIAAKKGWTIKTYVTDFATLVSALKAKKADVIVDAMYITDKRKLEINFTNEWYTEGEGMLVPAGSTITTRDQLKGKVLGAQTGTVFADFIKTLGGKETKFFDSQAALVAATENKQVDAVITDSAVLGYSLVQKPNPKVRLVTPYKTFFPGHIGAGVRKEDTQLLADLNSGLADLKSTSQYLEILKKYGLGQDNVAN